MISIKKTDNAPNSLAYPAVSTISKNVHKRRMELIAEGRYTDTGIYNSRYKHDDTKTALNALYNRKCCYCERRTESFHVEHYRPKTLYWWLVYSWDNLLFVCAACNTNKGAKFEILGEKAIYNNDIYLDNIHTLSVEYNKMEQPSLLKNAIDKFVKKTKNPKEPYIAFRLYVIRVFLADILSNLNQLEVL